MVCLRKAIYGHPESEAAWDAYLHKHLASLGWKPVPGQPSCFLHSVSGALLVVYVDDLLLLSHEHETAKLWQQIEKVIKFSVPPSPIGRYLGAHYNFPEMVRSPPSR